MATVDDLIDAVIAAGRSVGQRLAPPHGRTTLTSSGRRGATPGRYSVTFRRFGLLGPSREPAVEVLYEDHSDPNPATRQWMITYYLDDQGRMGACRTRSGSPLVELDVFMQALEEASVPEAFGWNSGFDMLGH